MSAAAKHLPQIMALAKSFADRGSLNTAYVVRQLHDRLAYICAGLDRIEREDEYRAAFPRPVQKSA